KLDAREGPEPAMEALNPMNDWAYPMPDGRSCILKYHGSGFDVWVGDNDGARPLEPNVGCNGAIDPELLTDSRLAVTLSHNEVWEADFETGTAKKVLDAPTGEFGIHAMADDGLVRVHEGELLLYR